MLKIVSLPALFVGVKYFAQSAAVAVPGAVHAIIGVEI
jgi:hypothetical protein